MADSTGGMFEARLKLEDNSSDVIEGINNKIDKAVGNTDKLQKEFKRLHERLDKMHSATKTIVKDTNNIGMIGSALLGIEDKGSIKEQFLGLKKMAGSFYKFMAGAAVDATLNLADAALWAAEKVGMLYYVMSGTAALMKFPAILVGSGIEATKLTGVIEELRHSILLTNDGAIKMGKTISGTMLQTGSDIELVIEAMTELAHLNQINTTGAEKLQKATVYLAEAWRIGATEAARFLRKVTTLYEARDNVMGVASAMDYVARSTAISRGELTQLVDGLEHTLLYKIPKDLRSKVMPRMLADIAAIAGEWANVFGSPEEVTRGFNQVLDIFDDQGQKLRAMVVGMGGATAEAVQGMIESGDAGSFWVAQIKAVQNLKDELGDTEFTQVAGIWAQQFGMSRETFMKMADANVALIETRRKAAAEELENTKSIRDSWDKAMGVFNDVWGRLENIGKALLIGIGEPLLNILVPALEWFGKKLIWVLELFQNLGESDKKMMGMAAVFGTIAATLKSALIPALTFLWTKLLIPVGAFLAKWGVGTAIASAFAAVAIAIAKAVAIGVVLLAVFKAIYDFGGAFLEGFAPVLEKVWKLLKVMAAAALAFFAPLVVVLIAVVKYWDEFYAAMKPGLDTLKVAWMDMMEVFRRVGSELSKAFGDGKDNSADFFEIVGKGLKWLAGAIGTVVGGIARVIGWLVTVIGVLAAAVIKSFEPVIWVMGRIYDFIMMIIGATVDLVNMIPGISIGGGSAAGTTEATATQATISEVGQPADIASVVSGDANYQPMGGGGFNAGSSAPQVYIDQDTVVDELKEVRSLLERMSRSGGLAQRLQGS